MFFDNNTDTRAHPTRRAISITINVVSNSIIFTLFLLFNDVNIHTLTGKAKKRLHIFIKNPKNIHPQGKKI